jgi:hypothetical protein
MDKKKALLLLVGGRPLPNMLTVIQERPEIVLGIVSQDEKWKMEELRKAITIYSGLSGYKPEIIDSRVVDAFQLEEIKNACIFAMKEHTDCDWIFNITAATKIMCIAAYEVAKAFSSQNHSIQCWYLDTQHSRVVSIVGEARESGIFKVTMDEYAAACNCEVSGKDLEFLEKKQRQFCQDNWVPFVEFLVQNSVYIDALKRLIQIFNAKNRRKPSKGKIETYPINIPVAQAYPFLEIAEQTYLIQKLDREHATFSLDDVQARFFEGAWLELYVWSEAQKLQYFDYCEWNQKLLLGNRPKEKDPDNELDVTLLYNAQLIVIECKARQASFEPSYLSALASAVHPLGENAVSKIFVTSQPVPSGTDKNINEKYDRFKEKAQDKRIRVVSREELPNIGQIISQQIKRPTYARI